MKKPKPERLKQDTLTQEDDPPYFKILNASWDNSKVGQTFIISSKKQSTGTTNQTKK